MSTGLFGFHFADPVWLWALLLPVLFWAWPWRGRGYAEQTRLQRYADPHLLPHLMLGGPSQAKYRRWLALWSLLWCLGTLAMAGPRLGYRDVSLYGPGSSLVILLDLSRSMEVEDVKPSRLARARQEIEDLLDRSQGMRVGLIAFASVAHVVAPITEDDETLRHLLPSISTDLVRWQGSRLSQGLERARRLLSGQPKDNVRALLLITDGDFAEPGLEKHVDILRREGIPLHVLGVGTTSGGPVPSAEGGWIRAKNGQPVVSRLEEQTLEALARAGGGVYRRADFRDDDTLAILRQVAAEGSPRGEETGTQRVWDERYYIPVLLMMFLMLRWYRRSAVARG
jgi:Ca-activated chloride channel family protein